MALDAQWSAAEPTGFGALLAADQDMLDAVPAGIYVCRHDGALLRCNRRATEIWGRTPKNGEADEHFCGVFHFYDADGAALAYAATPTAVVLRTGESLRGRKILIERPDGSRVFVLVDVEPFRNSDGAVEGAIGCLRDILDRKENAVVADLALRRRAEETQNLLASIIESSIDAIITIDVKGRITNWNRGAAQLYGYSADEIIGQPMAVLIPEEKYDDEAQVLSTLLRGERLEHYETVRVHKDGNRIHVSLSVSPLRNASGAIVGAAKIARDIGQHKRAEATLARRAEEQGALYRFVDRLRRCQTIAAACKAAIDAIRCALRCERASVLLFDERDVMRFVAWHGLSDGYRAAVDGHSPWTPETKDAQPIAIGDLAAADIPDALKETIAAEGIAALSFVPLYAENRLIGKFMTYYENPHEFGGGEMDLALAIARQLGLSVERFRAAESRQSAMAQLRASEERYRAVVESQSDSLCRFRMDGEILFVNDAYARLCGDQANGLIGQNFWNFVPESDQAGVRALLDRLTPEAPEIQIENRFETVRGTTWMLWTNRALSFDADGKVVEAQSTGIDISARKNAEVALQESQQRLQLALSAGKMGTWEWDLRSNRVAWSANLEEIHGLPSGSFGGTIEDFKRDIHPHDLDRVLAQIQRALSGADDYHVVYRAKTADGGVRWLEAYGTVVCAETGKPEKLTGVCIDVTARKDAEEERELLLAELNHRVKNTLATVLSIAQLSFKNAASPDDARRALDARIRSLAKVHDRLSEANWSGLSLEDVILDEVSPYRRSDGRNLRLSGLPMKLHPKAGLQLGMAMHELATNAAKYGAFRDDNGVVDVTWETSADGQELRIDWTETVPAGIDPPVRSGFGRLFLERALKSNLGGQVEMAFTKSGLHCSFALPTSRVAPPLPSSDAKFGDGLAPGSLTEGDGRLTANDGATPIRVLVVEDEPLLGMVMEQDLQANGYSVLGPYDGLASAAMASRKEEFDLALLDINLNGELSYPIADELLDRGIPFILVSGYGFSDLPERFRTLPRLAKPYDPHKLIDEVRNLAPGQGLQRQPLSR